MVQSLKYGKENKIHHHNSKEHLKLHKITKFGCQMLLNKASQSFQILYIVVLRTEKVTTLEPSQTLV